jgi:hypothetical protein
MSNFFLSIPMHGSVRSGTCYRAGQGLIHRALSVLEALYCRKRLNAMKLFKYPLWLLLSFAVSMASAQQNTASLMKTEASFGVSETGAATYRIPIDPPKGLAGLQPELALEYNSQRGNGIAGMGWRLAGLPSIVRCPRTLATDKFRKPVTYAADDGYCLDGKRLIAVAGVNGADGTEYRTEIETFSKITSSGSANGPISFIVKTKNGRIYEYGTEENARVWAQYSGPTLGGRLKNQKGVAVWLVNKISDIHGNWMTVSYKNEVNGGLTVDGEFYPTAIYYGYTKNSYIPLYKISFNYEQRADNYPFYYGGSINRLNNRLIGIDIGTVFSNSSYRKFILNYEQKGSPVFSTLISLTECESGSSGVCMPSILFTYAKNISSPVGDSGLTIRSGVGAVGRTDFSSNILDKESAWVDFNGDGKADYCRRVTLSSGEISVGCLISTGLGFEESGNAGNIKWQGRQFVSHPNLSQDRPLSTGHWVDINGDFKVDFCRIDRRAPIGQCWLSTGVGFSERAELTGLDHLGNVEDCYQNDCRNNIPKYLNDIHYLWFDLNGDGKMDLCTRKSIHNSYRPDGSSGEITPAGVYIICKISVNGFLDTTYGALKGAFSDKENLTYSPGGRNAESIVTKNSAPFFSDYNNDGFFDLCYASNRNSQYDSKLNGSKIVCFASTGDHILSNRESQFEMPVNFSIYGKAYDINGDGIDDYCSYFGDSIGCYINSGNQFIVKIEKRPSYIDSSQSSTSYYIDINNDGFIDHCYGPTKDSEKTGKVGCSVFNGKDGFNSTNITPFSPDIAHKFPKAVAWADVNGDGTPDYCGIAKNESEVVCHLSHPPDTLVLTRIAHNLPVPLGIRTDIEYVALSQASSGQYVPEPATYPTVAMIYPLPVVAKMSTVNDAGGTTEYTYSYKGLKTEWPAGPGLGRGSLGFSSMQRRNAASGKTEETQFLQTWPYIGLPAQVSEIHTASGKVLSKTNNVYAKTEGSYTPTSVKSVFPYLEAQWKQEFELAGLAFPSVGTFWEYGTSPQQGEPTSVLTIAEGDCRKVDVKQNYRAADWNNWVIGRLETRTSQASIGDPPVACPPGSGNNHRTIGSGYRPPPPPPQPDPSTQTLGFLLNILFADD